MNRLNKSRRLWLSGIATLLGGWLCFGGKGNVASAIGAVESLEQGEPDDETLYSYCDGLEEAESVTIYEFDELGRVTRIEMMNDE